MELLADDEAMLVKVPCKGHGEYAPPLRPMSKQGTMCWSNVLNTGCLHSSKIGPKLLGGSQGTQPIRHAGMSSRLCRSLHCLGTSFLEFVGVRGAGFFGRFSRVSPKCFAMACTIARPVCGHAWYSQGHIYFCINVSVYVTIPGPMPWIFESRGSNV